jgi:hypothetical protein
MRKAAKGFGTLDPLAPGSQSPAHCPSPVDLENGFGLRASGFGKKKVPLRVLGVSVANLWSRERREKRGGIQALRFSGNTFLDSTASNCPRVTPSWL